MNYIPNSIFIGIDGSFATWVGTLIDVKQELLIVADEDKVEEAVTRLARMGYDSAKGYLKGGFEAWKNAGKEIDSVESVTIDQLADIANPVILDVLEAINVPLDYI